MELLHQRCAGVDVHRDTIVVCARIAKGKKVVRELETFGTTTCELERAVAWLHELGITHVLMEATGVYWRPVWAVLSESLELTLANAAHVKNVPGRKTDANDAQWLSDLLAHGLMRASFVPLEEQQALRDITRTRKQLVRQRATHLNRIDKLLQTANIKLGSVVRDIMGVAGRAILDALAKGETDAEKLADCVQTNIKASRSAVVAAVHGRFTDHHRLLLTLHLEQVDSVNVTLAKLDDEIGRRLEGHQALVKRLLKVPGVSTLTMPVIIAEVGVRVANFPSAAHLVSWAGLCPRSDESAGKRRSTKLRKGAPWLKTALVQAAWGAARTRNGYYRAMFGRLRARRGSKKAVIAIAASILTTIYHLIRRGTDYVDLGPDHFDRRDKRRAAARLVGKIRNLGFEVQLQPGTT